MSVQLYLDEDVDPLLAQVLRDRGINCLSTQEAGNRGKSDSEKLSFALNQVRVFLTFNVKDFAQFVPQSPLSLQGEGQGEGDCLQWAERPLVSL